MRRIGMLGGVIAVLTVCYGCGWISGVDEDDRCRSRPDMEIQVEGEVWFSWGRCRVDQLTVVDSDFRAAWSVEGLVRSPIQYGVAGKKTETQAGPDPLQVGATYTLVLAVDSDGEQREVFEWQFTR